MDQVTRSKVLEGRKAVDAYREAHRQLHSEPWHRGIPEEHMPLLDEMLSKLKGQGFSWLQKFFDTSELLNIQELGFSSKEDFEAKATEADRETLSGMWR